MERKRLLLAEDDMLLRKSLAYYLAENNFEVVQVSDGAQAVEELKNNLFDVIITDLNMPYVGGLEIINLLRNELQSNTPVIVLTSSGVEKVELESFSIGANEFISKPLSPSVLMARINKLVG